MATDLLAVGTTAANSSDLVVASGSTVTIGITDATGQNIGSFLPGLTLPN